MDFNIYQSSQTQEIIQFVREQYGDEPEFLWAKSPANSIFRNRENRKWYAALLTIGQGTEIIDLRFFAHEAPYFVAENPHVRPGYHMNKDNWITVILDGSVPTAEICALLDQSYRIVAAGQ